MAKHYYQLKKILTNLLYNRRMNPAELAREVGIPVPTIHRLVTGKSTRPYLSSLKPLADYFSLSINQLLGEEPLPSEYFNEKTKDTALSTQTIKTIPIVAWANFNDPLAKKDPKKYVVTAGNISNDSFALVMKDYSMEPLFPKESTLIFDPQKTPIDRSYILVQLASKKEPIFRQLIIDVDHKYLKPLNPDGNIYKMRLLEENDAIVGCLIESRLNHNFDNISEGVFGK